ncbi:MAG: dockerin type I repeat-containing protein [Oscillospiraceae bacterium]|nr:dockerin type I repeat-containing protein [Oscillospiraceae bacterium]
MNNDGVVNAADLSKLKALLKYKIGDVNRDGKINSTDITLIKNHISKKAILSDAVLWYADVNGDGSIDISDFMKLGNDYNIPY